MSTSRFFATTLLAAILSGCSGQVDTSPPAPSALGTLSVHVIGLDSGVAAGGAISVARTDGARWAKHTYPVPQEGLLEVPVPVGTYGVSYIPPDGYKVVSFSPSTAATAVTVAENTATPVQFGVRLADGTIGLIANITTAPFPDSGGSVSFVRTDVTNARDTVVTIPNEATEGYYVVVSRPPGTYRVTYRAPDGYAILPGDGYTVSGGTGTTTVPVGANYFEWLTFQIVAKSP